MVRAAPPLQEAEFPSVETEPCANEQGGHNVSVSHCLGSGSGSGSTAADYSSVGPV